MEDCHPDWKTCYAAEQADLVNPEQLTRKEQKAMDREIPWREIVSQGGEYLKAFVEAAQKECDSWREWGPVRPLSKEEALRVLRDPALKGRVLKARVLLQEQERR